jgi:hypothetical protein
LGSVYKQENGENYLYYNSGLKSWMVASYVGNEYAWMKYQVPNVICLERQRRERKRFCETDTCDQCYKMFYDRKL